MSDNNISNRELELICEYYSNLERQGPGSSDVTQKALSFIDPFPSDALIADIGCGTGGQTLVLAENIQGKITAIDLFPLFINILNSNSEKRGFVDRIKGEIASMDALTFKDSSLDLIWSEGAIYNIGFENGLNQWHRFIKKGGYIAVTEISWFTNERPKEIDDFWNHNYPEIDTISNKISQMQNSGYVPVASFILPEECWTDNYYKPQVPVQKAFLDKYKGDTFAKELIEGQLQEAKLYEKYKDFYGYVFYIGKKI